MKCFDDDRLDYDPETGKFTWLVDRNGCKKGAVAGGSASNGYVRIKLDGKMHQAHRLAWNTMHQDDLLGPDDEIDHIDHDTLNNRIDNLRKVSAAENMRNKVRYRVNKSGVTGVDRPKKCKRWRARIRVAGVLIELGHFDSFDAAVAARKAAEKDHCFHKNHGVCL